MLGSSLIDNFLLTMNGPHMGYHVLQRFTKETLESFPILSLRICRTRHVPDTFNHPVHLNTLLGSSNPDGPVRLSSQNPEHNERFAVSRRASTRVSPDFTVLGLHAPSFKSQQSRSRSVAGAHVQAFTFIALAPHINTKRRRRTNTQTDDTDTMCVAFAHKNI